MTNVTLNRNIPDDHKETVIIKNDGKFEFTSNDIALSDKMTNKTRYVLPQDDEKVVKLSEHKEYFENLMFINLILTNACNLSCNYCYEQHNQDFGRFTTQTIKKIWDWLKTINNQRKKTMSFFGGEPLLYKKLIVDFIEENREELTTYTDGSMNLGLTTNGLLLSKNFINHYFSIPNTKMMVSLDTIKTDLDHRNITQEKMDHLLNLIEYAAKTSGDARRFAIRATVTREGASYLREFWEELYNRGVRQLIFHPLILSQSSGFIEWPEDEWKKLSDDLKNVIIEYPDVENLKFAEGIGIKGETNCLTGSSTIAVDASGDFSGCYFFTNRKNSGAGKMLIGNVLNNTLYIDRYKGFHESYQTMFESHDECNTCNYKNTCYQCPAGNISVGDAIFRPDAMCKRFAKLDVEVRNLQLQNAFKKKLTGILESKEAEGEIVYARAAVHLFLRFFNDVYSDNEEVKSKVVDIYPNKVWAYFDLMLKADLKNVEQFTVDDVINGAKNIKSETSPKKIYTLLRAYSNSDQEQYPHIQDEDLLYTTLLHFVIANTSKFKYHEV